MSWFLQPCGPAVLFLTTVVLRLIVWTETDECLSLSSPNTESVVKYKASSIISMCSKQRLTERSSRSRRRTYCGLCVCVCFLCESVPSSSTFCFLKYSIHTQESGGKSPVQSLVFPREIKHCKCFCFKSLKIVLQLNPFISHKHLSIWDAQMNSTKSLELHKINIWALLMIVFKRLKKKKKKLTSRKEKSPMQSRNVEMWLNADDSPEKNK